MELEMEDAAAGSGRGGGGFYESFVPGGNLNRGSRRNQLRRGYGSPLVLSEVPHELSTAAHYKECKRSPQ